MAPSENDEMVRLMHFVWGMRKQFYEVMNGERY